MINNLLHDHYQIVNKLRFSDYSTIWLTQNNQSKHYVIIKVRISSLLLSWHELSILHTLSDSRSTSQAVYAVFNACNTVLSILDEFNIQGLNGTHACYTVTFTQGNLKEALFSCLFFIQVAQILTARLIIAVFFVHSHDFVHEDLFIVSSYDQSNKTKSVCKYSSSKCISQTFIDLWWALNRSV